MCGRSCCNRRFCAGWMQQQQVEYLVDQLDFLIELFLIELKVKRILFG